MTSTDTLVNYQIVDYNKKYQINLDGFDDIQTEFKTITIKSTEFTAQENKELFEKALICKIYGIDYIINDKELTCKFTDICYHLYYGKPKQSTDKPINNDMLNCYIGIVSDFSAKYKDSANTTQTLTISDPYLFVYAHKTADDPIDNEDILRVHKIVKIPNSKFITKMDRAENKLSTIGLVTDSTNPLTLVGVNFTKNASGAVRRTTKKSTFKSGSSSGNGNGALTEGVFYLPEYSYLLEGRTQHLFNFPSTYTGCFDIQLIGLEEIDPVSGN